MINKALLLVSKPNAMVEYGGAHFYRIHSEYVLDMDNVWDEGETVVNSDAINPWEVSAEGPKYTYNDEPSGWMTVHFEVATDGYSWGDGDFIELPEGQGWQIEVYSPSGSLFESYEYSWIERSGDGLIVAPWGYSFGGIDEQPELPVGEWTFVLKLKVGEKQLELTAKINFPGYTK